MKRLFQIALWGLLIFLGLSWPTWAQEEDTAMPAHNGWSYTWGHIGEHQPPQTQGWTALTPPLTPKHTGQQYLWLRYQVPHTLPYHDPHLYLRGVDQSFRVFAQGRVIYQFGQIPQATPSNNAWYPGFGWHMIPLKAFAGQALYFQIYSQHQLIGIFGEPRLGNPIQHAQNMLRQELGMMLVAFILMVAALLLLSLPGRFIARQIFFYLACFVFVSGIFVLARSESKQIMLSAPLVWRWVERVSLLIAAVLFVFFLEAIFTHTKLRWFKFLAWLEGIAVLNMLGITALGYLALWQLQQFSSGLILFNILVSIGVLILSYRRYPQEARIFIVGLACFFLPVLHDIMITLHVFPWRYPVGHWGLLGFLLTQIYLLRTRVISIYQEKRVAEMANQHKDQFLATISHEFRTPLTAIMGFTELLASNTHKNLDKQQLRFLEQVTQNSQHLLQLVNDLLDIAKINAGKIEVNPETFALHPYCFNVEKMMEPLLKNRNNTFTCIIKAAESAEIHTDKQHLTQILMNLLSNAAKFTEQGQIQLIVSLQTQQFLFQVKDTGMGIAPEKLDQLFQDFTQLTPRNQRKIKGTGLGLSLSQKLAQQLGGKITVQSEVGQGSCFTLTLPQDYEPLL